MPELHVAAEEFVLLAIAGWQLVAVNSKGSSLSQFSLSSLFEKF